MSENKKRAIYGKLSKEEDDLLQFAMHIIGTDTQIVAIRESLKFFKENHEQISLLKEMVKSQNDIKNIITEIYYRGK